jgi:hypothetical protein
MNPHFLNLFIRKLTRERAYHFRECFSTHFGDESFCLAVLVIEIVRYSNRASFENVAGISRWQRLLCTLATVNLAQI